MSVDNLPQPENEQYDPNLEAQDDEVTSGGSNRLMYILVGIMAALVIGYVALPKGKGSALASVAPSFMLDDAAVTATLPTAADSIAAGLKAAPAAAAETNAKAATPVTAKPTDATRRAPAAPAAPNPVVSEAAPAAAPAPVIAAAPTPAAAPVVVPAAPASMTITGKIEDENGRPLVGATVLMKGSSKGTSTDANGNYSLEVPSDGDNTLVYGYGGYDDESMRVRNNQAVNVTLTPRAKEGKKKRR